MVVLSGPEVSKKLREQIKRRAEQFNRKYGRPPGLAVVIVGNDVASHVYVKNKIKASQEVGVKSFHHECDEKISEKDLLALIQNLNIHPEVDGILVQLPLPKHLNTEKILGALSPRRDPDGLTPENMGLLAAGRPRISPCTPSGVMEILKHYDIPVAGRHAVVVGRSQIVGRPMAQLFLMSDATVTVVHSKTPDIRKITQQADIVVVAAGRPLLFGKDDFKKGAVVVDVGIHRTEKGIVGDVRFSELEGHAKAATPVPGGVGPMTITKLLENTVRLAELAKT